MAASLSQVAERTDSAIAAARADLVHAVREAAASGMTQQQIAREIRRSQPEVSRLLRFHGTSPLARQLRARTPEIRDVIGAAGGTRVRVFGSVARGDDGPTSDVDLLFSMDRPLSLMELGTLEARVALILGADVDLVPESSLSAVVRDRALAEAVPL